MIKKDETNLVIRQKRLQPRLAHVLDDVALRLDVAFRTGGASFVFVSCGTTNEETDVGAIAGPKLGRIR